MPRGIAPADTRTVQTPTQRQNVFAAEVRGRDLGVDLGSHGQKSLPKKSLTFSAVVSILSEIMLATPIGPS